MVLRPALYYTLSFLIALASCVVFVASAYQVYGDFDYVHKHLGYNSKNISELRPITGSFYLSSFWVVVHLLAHIVFILITRSKSAKAFRIRFGYYGDEKNAAWLVKTAFYLFAAYLVYDYVYYYYKFYFFELLSTLTIVLTVLVYSLTISNLINARGKNQADHKKPYPTLHQ